MGLVRGRRRAGFAATLVEHLETHERGPEKQLVEGSVIDVSACWEGIDCCKFNCRRGAIGQSVTTTAVSSV
jgi:hypothetical protein